jgi:tetratricopeptide (TPR) repeat protein
VVRRQSPTGKGPGRRTVRCQARRDRRQIAVAAGLGLALLLIGAAWCGGRVGVPGTTAAREHAGADRAGVASAETERQLLEAIARDPRNAGAHARLGSHYLAVDRPFEALWELQEGGALGPNDPAFLLGRVDALAAARLPETAIAELRVLLERHPEHPEISRRLADLSLAVGQPERAVAVLRAVPEPDRSPEALLLLARSYHSLRRYKEAERALQQARRLQPDAWEPAYHLGHLYLDRGDVSRAEAAFLAASTAAPDRPEPHHGLGLAFLQRRDPSRAEAAFRAAIERAPAYGPAHRELGRLLLDHRQYREAGDHFLQAIRGGRDVEACARMAEALAAVGRRVEAQYYWGLYYTRKDLRPRAAAAFRQMAALDRDRTEAVLLLTETYIRMNQEHRGIGIVKAALKRHPRDPALYERLATLYVATIDRPGAARACREWLRQDPNAAAAHWILGRVTIETPRVEEGMRALEEAVAREPGNPEFAYTLASALLRRPSPESRQRALRLLEEAIRQAPDVARYRNQLGLTLRQQGDLEGARRQFLRSLDLDPHQPPVYTNLVALAGALRRPHQVRFWAPLVRAVEDRTREELRLWRAVWDRPQDADACYRLAQFLVRTGEPVKAESQLDEALRLRPGWPEARAMRERVSGIVRARHLERG